MVRSYALIFLGMFLLSACSVPPVLIAAPVEVPVEVPAGTEGTQVTGKVTVGPEKAPVAGIKIAAYPLDSPHLRGKPPFVSAETGDDGLFAVSLSVGSYFFIAEGQGLFSYYGRNPVTVAETGLAGMNPSLVARDPHTVETESQIDTGILGHVYAAGKPVGGVVISVYTDLTTQLKGQGLGMTAPTDSDGRFEAPLQAGTYYLVARKRQSGNFMGPLQAGDFFGYYADNPVQIKEGQVLRVPLSLLEVPEKVNQLGESMFGATSVAGRVVDSSGQPVTGIRVLLYDNPMMLNRPLFVSQSSGVDGEYVISFPQGGTYWLAARNQLGGPPMPGQLYGRYLGSADGSVVLKGGQRLKNIELVVEEMQ